jgi:hypothetical protein
MPADSGGLYQRVNEAGTKSWIFRFTQSGKLRAEIRNRSIPARLRSGPLEQRTRPGEKTRGKSAFSGPARRFLGKQAPQLCFCPRRAGPDSELQALIG